LIVVERRNLLRAVAAAPAVPLITAAAAPSFDVGRTRFAVAVLPDTQYLFDADSADPAPLRATLAYLLAHRAEHNIAFLAQLGDLTEHGTEPELGLVGETFRQVDGRLPYSVVAGNHDITATTDDQRGGSPYLATFGPARYRSDPTFLSATADGYNTAHRITAGGRRWLILALDWRVSDAGLAWARAILAANPTAPAIVTTHDLAYSDEDGRAFLSGHGQRLWTELIKDSDQIFLALGGHDWPPGRSVLANAAGHDVHVHIANYQDRYYGGAGMVRLYHVDLVRNRIDVETFAPWLLARDPARRTRLEAQTSELTGDEDRFSLAVDFDRRFAGFAPPAPPVAVSLVGAHTVAYWRFDTPGQSVADGAVVRDQSGGGNDLTVLRLPGSGADVLTVSADHHPGAPGRASLRFDGGLTPDRGALLRTGPAAAIDGMTFPDGFTIEMYFKLPAPFIGEHSWMGLFSREGRAGDAGKRSGPSPLDPLCSLNLAPDFFLQYVVYSAEGDQNPTSWSHALPTGVWQHVAIVNDGRRGSLWVDGSRVVRNPARPARGIATVGRPFVLGATAFDLAYRQSFYGWIGDVRITARALAPPDFLPAAR
jgi:hypothetical protein